MLKKVEKGFCSKEDELKEKMNHDLEETFKSINSLKKRLKICISKMNNYVENEVSLMEMSKNQVPDKAIKKT